MQKQEVTIYDVAREAKVSMATVSRVVNGNNNVRKETRDRVLAVIDRLHYQPNAVAQGLASKKTTTVGLIVPGFTNLHFAELSQGIDDIATMYKYNILLSSVENKLLEDDQVIQNLLNKQVDGVIYMSNQMSEKARNALIRTNTPVVLAGTIDSNPDFGSVAIDYEKAEETALNILYQDGKRNLALVLNDEKAYVNAAHRIKAYNKFMSDHNLTPHIYSEIKSYEDGYKIFNKMYADKIDGVIATRDMAAAGILNAAQDNNVKVPEELEIISAASTMVAEIVRPKMTTIRQPLYDIGAVAMRMLTKMMNNEDVDDLHITLPLEVIEANTTLNK
ncbi:substrate-binding domain-containing protein [uncultured Lactobacillus sp.]|uniref:substrate-binding domain-containing protein n=1 Tax=uncultured Lactobacillus sp. TaxID=153152 RepID=UPI00261E5F98|nr:substrate-binding domain-containing protein [uncultured Lactobacillus sp.]